MLVEVGLCHQTKSKGPTNEIQMLEKGTKWKSTKLEAIFPTEIGPIFVGRGLSEEVGDPRVFQIAKKSKATSLAS